VRVSVGDVELHVHELGEGRPLLALHGGPGLDGSIWFPGLEPLAGEGWWILAPDHRGNGRSDAGDPERWTVPQMADDVEAIISSLGLERPVVMGWSFGSFVTQAHMVRHASASAYVLMGTVAEPGALEWIDGELERFEPVHLREQVASSWARESSVQTPEEAKRLLDDQWPFHLADPESPLIKWLIENDKVVYRPDVLRHFAVDGAYGLEDWRDALCRCAVPTLVLSGAHDRTTATVSAHELAELLPNADEAVIADAAHVAIYEQPDATLAALRTFLAGV
jgi:pimeloyl-ACP methyl ester carboxylesterase